MWGHNRINYNHINNANHIKDPVLLDYNDNRLKANCEAVAAFHNKTTPEQRTKARAKLKDYEEVLVKLTKPR